MTISEIMESEGMTEAGDFFEAGLGDLFQYRVPTPLKSISAKRVIIDLQQDSMDLTVDCQMIKERYSKETVAICIVLNVGKN